MVALRHNSALRCLGRVGRGEDAPCLARAVVVCGALTFGDVHVGEICAGRGQAVGLCVWAMTIVCRTGPQLSPLRGRRPRAATWSGGRAGPGLGGYRPARSRWTGSPSHQSM